MTSTTKHWVDDAVAFVKRAVHPDALPKSKTARLTIGVALVVGGALGFLPILGFWMLPLGLAVLAIDIPVVRRLVRRAKVALGRWRQRRKKR